MVWALPTTVVDVATVAGGGSRGGGSVRWVPVGSDVLVGDARSGFRSLPSVNPNVSTKKRIASS